MYRWKRLLPLLGSAALITWLIWRVSPQALGQALAGLNWGAIVPLTLLLVLATYLWDALGLWFLFADPDHPLTYRAVLGARGRSYFFTAFNFGLGQGYLAWIMAQVRQATLAWSVSRCMLLVYVDLYVLLGLGLFGASLSMHPHSRGITVFCVSGLSALVLVTLLVRCLPSAWIGRLRQTRWSDWLTAQTWNWRRILQLCVLRTAYFAWGMGYAVAGLRLCGIHIETMLVLSAIPIMALVDGLPIGTSGLGTRETTLLLLLQPEQPARLLAFCLTWSAGVIAGRGLLGLVHLWLPQPGAPSPVP